jgi:hypothetical protein
MPRRGGLRAGDIPPHSDDCDSRGKTVLPHSEIKKPALSEPASRIPAMEKRVVAPLKVEEQTRPNEVVF